MLVSTITQLQSYANLINVQFNGIWLSPLITLTLVLIKHHGS